MTVPNYLRTFRRAVREQQELAAHERQEYALNAVNAKRVSTTDLNALNTFNASPPAKSFEWALTALEARCPDRIPEDRWSQAIEDGRAFLTAWGAQAHALGWTADELLGLHRPPEKPQPGYSRLSRYDCTGLIWLLQGRRVVALTEGTAAIEGHTGNIVNFRKANKPAFGPLGDSVDDFV